MSVPARVMGIADIFEALTAPERPYKKPMPLTQALTILGRMKLEGHIDPDLFDVFIREKVYLRYAHKYLSPNQIDAVDLSLIPGCAAATASVAEPCSRAGRRLIFLGPLGVVATAGDRGSSSSRTSRVEAKPPIFPLDCTYCSRRQPGALARRPQQRQIHFRKLQRR